MYLYNVSVQSQKNASIPGLSKFILHKFLWPNILKYKGEVILNFMHYLIRGIIQF